MPHDGPLHCQPLQKNQSDFVDRSGFPSVIADFNFCAVRLGNDVLICWKSNNTIYPAIFLPQLLQLLSLLSPTPTIDEPQHDYANNQGNGCSSYPRPSAKSVGHEFLDYAGQCDHQHHGSSSISVYADGRLV